MPSACATAVNGSLPVSKRRFNQGFRTCSLAISASRCRVLVGSASLLSSSCNFNSLTKRSMLFLIVRPPEPASGPVDVSAPGSVLGR